MLVWEINKIFKKFVNKCFALCLPDQMESMVKPNQ